MHQNNMKKYAPLFVAVLIIVFGFWVYAGKKQGSEVPAPTASGTENTISSEQNTGDNQTTPAKPLPKDPAWDTLALYLARLKAHDIEGVKNLSHQQSDTCKDNKKQTECFKLMDSAYLIGAELKQESYIYRAEDTKQLILTTKVEKDSMGTSTVGLVRGQVVFTKTPLGDYKILSFDLGKGLYRTSTSTPVEEIYKNLESVVVDSDKDGLFDEEEQCLGDFAYPGCVKTDPKKNDTDGDGWWDGVEVFFKK